MKSMIDRVRSAATPFLPSRAVVCAMVLGPVAGVFLALGSLQAEDAANTVKIDNFTFTPPELHVKAGTTVTWVNHDDIPHNVVETNKAFRSKALDTDDSYTFTFASAGTFSYFCGLHPHMTGKVIVE
jgi:amicyanin